MEIEWVDLWAGIALLLVFEGMMPFLSPSSWRKMILLMAAQNNQAMRLMGLISMTSGALLLYFTR